MSKFIAIVAGEPNSISSEIIFKVWKKRKTNKLKPFFVIASINLLNLQKKRLKQKIKIKQINNNINIKNFSKNELPVYNVEYKQRKAFEKLSKKSSSYIYKCFDIAINLVRKSKILGFVNCPISKEKMLNNKYQGITEFLSKKTNRSGNEVMLIYNKKLSVSPLTTHIPIRKINNKITSSKIVKNTKTIHNFFRKTLKKNPKFGILGLNPHSSSLEIRSEEKDIISPAIRILKRKGIKADGPISPDTSFMFFKEKKIDVLIGMYHDQVLTPFKSLFKYKAINITLGLPLIRISPDHGIAKEIVSKNRADPTSLMECIKFFKYIK